MAGIESSPETCDFYVEKEGLIIKPNNKTIKLRMGDVFRVHEWYKIITTGTHKASAGQSVAIIDGTQILCENFTIKRASDETWFRLLSPQEQEAVCNPKDLPVEAIGSKQAMIQVVDHLLLLLRLRISPVCDSLITLPFRLFFTYGAKPAHINNLLKGTVDFTGDIPGATFLLKQIMDMRGSNGHSILYEAIRYMDGTPLFYAWFAANGASHEIRNYKQDTVFHAAAWSDTISKRMQTWLLTNLEEKYPELAKATNNYGETFKDNLQAKERP